MKVIADIMITPIGVGVSVSKYVAECQKIFEDAKLNPKIHSYGTNIEGEWDEVFDGVKNATKKFMKWTRLE